MGIAGFHSPGGLLPRYSNIEVRYHSLETVRLLCKAPTSLRSATKRTRIVGVLDS